MNRIFVSDEVARQQAFEVKRICDRVRVEVREKERARNYGFHNDFQFEMGGRDVIKIEHPKKPVTVSYEPDFSKETIATVVLRTRTDDVRSPQALLSRIKTLDEQKIKLMDHGVTGGVFTKYDGDRGMMYSGYQYEFNVPITSEPDLDRLLEVCADL